MPSALTWLAYSRGVNQRSRQNRRCQNPTPTVHPNWSLCVSPSSTSPKIPRTDDDRSHQQDTRSMHFFQFSLHHSQTLDPSSRPSILRLPNNRREFITYLGSLTGAELVRLTASRSIPRRALTRHERLWPKGMDPKNVSPIICKRHRR